MRLVRLDVTGPFFDRLPVAHPNFLRDLPDEPEVVGDQDQAACEFVDGGREGVDALHVKVVRRLVQKQDVGVHQGNQQHHDSCLHTIGHRLHLPRLELAGDAERAQLPAPSRVLHFLEAFCGDNACWVQLLQKLQRRQLQIEHGLAVLVVVPDAQLAAPLDFSDRRLNLLEHELEQGGLPSTVGTHKRDARVQVHAKLKVFVEVVLFLARVRKGYTRECQHWWRDLLRVGESELVRHIRNRLFSQTRLNHLVDNLLLRLRLDPHVGVGTARANELLQVLDVVVLLLPLGHLVFLGLRPRLHVLRVIPAPYDEGSLLRELHDVGAHAIHEVL
mmetsp:Transcript_7858/g.19431  ORF Transcript_7858/g.19431 Transcript_7858/m.19431 type:complete len:331 (-) Transcript_7858:884-1876(-)